MLRRDLEKVALERQAVERLLRYLLANRDAKPRRRDARDALFADDRTLTEASFVRAWNEALRRSTLARSEAVTRTARDEAPPEPRDP